MNQKPELSDDDIRSYMDFEGLLEKRKAVKGAQHFPRLWWASGIVVIGLACWLFFVDMHHAAPPAPVQQEKMEAPATRTDPQPALPGEAAQPDTESKPKKRTVIRKNAKKITLPEPKVPEIKNSVYVQAEPIDGFPALYEYFASNLVYPQEALKDSVQGVITVSFVINREGKAESVEVKQSLGEPFDREARRLIAGMPLWKPATLNGKEVASKISLPLTFQIERIKTPEQP